MYVRCALMFLITINSLMQGWSLGLDISVSRPDFDCLGLVSNKISYVSVSAARWRWRYSSTARKLGPLRNWTGGDWSRSTWGVSGGSSTSDGTTTYPTTKFCVALVCWQLLPSFANDVSDCSVMLPGLLTMYQQIGSFGPVAKHKTVSGHVPTGGVREADLLPPGLSRSAETLELRWPTPCGWQKTDRSGDKSQRREATAERFACRKEGRKVSKEKVSFTSQL